MVGGVDTTVVRISEITISENVIIIIHLFKISRVVQIPKNLEKNILHKSFSIINNKFFYLMRVTYIYKYIYDSSVLVALQ